MNSGRDHGKKIRLKETGCKRRASARCLAHVHLRSRRFVRIGEMFSPRSLTIEAFCTKSLDGVVPRTALLYKRPKMNIWKIKIII
jgi:hypothetical protein